MPLNDVCEAFSYYKINPFGEKPVSSERILDLAERQKRNFPSNSYAKRSELRQKLFKHTVQKICKKTGACADAVHRARNYFALHPRGKLPTTLDRIHILAKLLPSQPLEDVTHESSVDRAEQEFKAILFDEEKAELKDILVGVLAKTYELPVDTVQQAFTRYHQSPTGELPASSARILALSAEQLREIEQQRAFTIHNS